MKKIPAQTSKKSSKEDSQVCFFPVVGIGASAGGLDAFTQILKAIPSDTGMAFVLIQHLAPTHVSLLSEALAKVTSMPVRDIQSGMKVEANHVYVIPPSFDVNIQHGVLQLLARDKTPGEPHLPIDTFFRALAANCESRAIGVILSGTAADGTDGLRSIKTAGGLTFAQDPLTAKFSGMPESAVSAEVVDFCLPIPKLAEELIRVAKNHFFSGEKAEPFARSEDQQDFQKILNVLKIDLNVDFSEYKPATIKRRLARRLALLNVETLSQYLKILQKDPVEARALHDDVLIHVTSFFRDPEAFKKLKKDIFPQIVKLKQPKAPIRMWVTGCSTGEEVYSLAIAYLEFSGDVEGHRPVQIFGSDISERMIEKARAGFYPDHLMSGLSPDQLSRFFVKVEGGYRIVKFVRDLCVFVRHDLARDPPFSRLDLITCRNVLIYFDQALQKRILSIFHYCLNRPGFLLLGRTENVSSHQPLFSAEDKINKIFIRTAVTSRLLFPMLKHNEAAERRPVKDHAVEAKPSFDLSKTIDNILSDYAPCGVLINEHMEVLQFRGKTSLYLEQPSGLPETNLLKIVRPGLFVELKMALTKAKKEMTLVRKDGLKVRQNGYLHSCNLIVRPVQGPAFSKDRLFLILFEEVKVLAVAKKGKSSKKLSKKEIQVEERHSKQLEQELAITKEYLQSLIHEHQQTNEALATANEELVSGNEELQSLNEEMETAKEELQSTNEELTTINDELQNSSREVGQVNNDLINLLNSVEIPIVILDVHRRIRRFTPHARSIMNLLPTDIGRSIDDIKPKIKIENLDQLIAEVIDTVRVKELEVQDFGGSWYRIQIRPYKTLDNKIDGAVLSLVDINILKRDVGRAELARDYATSIVEGVQIPLVVLDNKLKILSANKAFYNIFGVSKAETENKLLYDLGISQWDIPTLRASLGDILANNTLFQNEEVERDFPKLGKRTMSLSAQSIHIEKDIPSMILLSMEDITERGEHLRQTLLSKLKIEESNAQLRQSQKHLSLALEAGQMGSWQIDLDTNSVSYSPELLSLYGFNVLRKNPSEVIRQVVHPEDAEELDRSMLLAFKNLTPFVFQYRIIRDNDKAVRWFESKGEARTNPDGTVSFIGIASDITQQKLAALEIEHSRQQLHEFFMQAPIPMVILEGPNHKFTLANPPYEKLTGRKVVGKTFLEVFTSQEVSQFIPLLDGVYKTGIPYDGTELKLSLPDVAGVLKDYWLSVGYYPFRDVSGGIKGVLAIHQDVTVQVEARKSLEYAAKKLANEQHMFETIFKESSSCMTLWSGENLVFEKANPAFMDLFLGRDILGKPLLEALPELINQEFPIQVKKVMQTGEPVVRKEALAVIARVEGGPLEDRYFDYSYLRVNDADGKPYGVFNHGIEVTEKVLARHALEESIKNLADERELRENFVMSLTHDLRTPLTAAKMSVQLVQRETQVPSKISKLSAVTSYLDRIDDMVRDLLDVTKIRGKEKLPLDISECDLNTITHSIIEVFVSTHGDRFILENEENLVGYWDPKALQRIIENLLSNAVKYGSLTTSISIGLKKKNGFMEICVHNEGNPIPPHEQQKLFIKFHRSSSARNSSQGGWGIGLTLVQGLAEAHGGNIQIESDLNKGTTFIVTLPQDARSFQTISS